MIYNWLHQEDSGKLFSCTSESTGTASISQFIYKIGNDNRHDDKLPDTRIFGEQFRLIAYITDDRMDLASVAGIHRRQFTDNAYCRQTASGKDISRI